MYSFPGNGIHQLKCNGIRGDPASQNLGKTLRPVESLPSGVQAIALPHCTLCASIPGKVHKTLCEAARKSTLFSCQSG